MRIRKFFLLLLLFTLSISSVAGAEESITVTALVETARAQLQGAKSYRVKATLEEFVSEGAPSVSRNTVDLKYIREPFIMKSTSVLESLYLEDSEAVTIYRRLENGVQIEYIVWGAAEDGNTRVTRSALTEDVADKIAKRKAADPEADLNNLYSRFIYEGEIMLGGKKAYVVTGVPKVNDIWLDGISFELLEPPYDPGDLSGCAVTFYIDAKTRNYIRVVGSEPSKQNESAPWHVTTIEFSEIGKVKPFSIPRDILARAGADFPGN